MEDAPAHIDFETASRTDLKKAGVYRYAEDPSTRVWGFRYRLGNGVIKQWRPGYPDPTDLLEHIAMFGIVVAHNAAFERTIWNWVIRVRYCMHWPKLHIQQQRCTMARAAALALPMDLDRLGEVLALTHQKDKEGHALMLRMAKPRTITSAGVAIWYDEPHMVDRLMQYCGVDVLVETDADAVLPPLTDAEQSVWELDQLINDRGIRIDVAYVERCQELADIAKKRADAEMRRITRGEVAKCTEVQKLVKWLNSRGIPCTSIKSKGEEHDELLMLTEIYDDYQAKAAVELRTNSAKTSTAKYTAFLNCVCSDGRVRGLLAYHGAATGRWAGRLVQPQNFVRTDADRDEVGLACLLSTTRDRSVPITEVAELVSLGVGNPITWLSRGLRQAIIADDGKKFLGADFSNVEGRANAWFAGETWKLEAFIAYDNHTGPDLYKLAYSKSFNVEIDAVGKQERQIGKVEELALGFQGGVGAFINMGVTYGLRTWVLADAISKTADPARWDFIASKYEKATDKCELPLREWTACKLVVMGWRDAHPAIVGGWWELQDAAVAAVAAPGTVQYVYGGKAAYYSDGNYLYCQLPSKRMLAYAQPELRNVEQLSIEIEGQWYAQELFDELQWSLYVLAGCRVRSRKRKQVTFWGVDGETKQWRKEALYGGMQCENIISGHCRDLLVSAAFRVEGAGYPVVLTVHDELLTEPWKWHGSAAEFLQLVTVRESWAQGFPLAAAAWEDERYTK